MPRTERRRWAVVGAWGVAAVLTSLLAEATIFKLGLVAIVFVGALGLHVLVNWSGELSLAQATFVGVPAFAVAQIATNAGVSPFLLLPVAVSIGGALGAVVSVAALRARGLQVALVTLAFAIAIGQYLFLKSWLVGPRAGMSLGAPNLFGLELRTSRSLVPVLVVVVALAVGTAGALHASKIGRALLLVKSDPHVAAAHGVPVAQYRAMAYAIAGAFAGLAGWSYVVWVQRVHPQAFPLQLGFTYLVIAALAGRGPALGVAMAALLVQGGELFAIIPHSVMVFLAPASLIVTVTKHPDGINGVVRSVRRAVSRPIPARPASAAARPLARLPLRRPAPDQPLLQVDRVSVRFGGLVALDAVSLDVSPGSTVGLIGPNGAGKTTLFNVISGLQRADSGRVRFDGVDITRLPPHRRAAVGISRSFQNLGLMQDETAATNVAAALHRSSGYLAADVAIRPWRARRAERRLGERALEALGAFGVADTADVVTKELSFGQARLVELAAIVAEAPPLVLLDEPTTGLDPVEVARLVEILAGLHRAGTTVLVVAHDVDFVMTCCDHVFVLAEGVLLFDGTPEAVRASPAVASSYLGRSA